MEILTKTLQHNAAKNTLTAIMKEVGPCVSETWLLLARRGIIIAYQCWADSHLRHQHHGEQSGNMVAVLL